MFPNSSWCCSCWCSILRFLVWKRASKRNRKRGSNTVSQLLWLSRSCTSLMSCKLNILCEVGVSVAVANPWKMLLKGAETSGWGSLFQSPWSLVFFGPGLLMTPIIVVERAWWSIDGQPITGRKQTKGLRGVGDKIQHEEHIPSDLSPSTKPHCCKC